MSPRETVKPQDLRPWPELQALLGPLARPQYEALKDSLREDGQRVPVLALPDGRIVDGHHRLQACEELGLKPLVQVLDLDDTSAFRLGLALNVSRRHLSVEQLRELREWQRRTYLEARRSGKTQAEAAALAGIPRQTGAWWEKMLGRAASSSVVSLPDLRVKVGQQAKREIAHRVASGERPEQVAADFGISTRHVHRIVAELRERKLPPPQDAQDEPECRVLTGDLWLLSDAVPDGEAAVFFTDPPYAEEYVHLYSQLAELAAAKLRPGGLCMTFCGHFHLPEVLAKMLEHLEYYWIFGFPLTGQHPVAWPRRIWVAWRPVLAMCKPPPAERKGGWVLDFPPSGTPEKQWHRWQQSTEPIRYWLERLTEPGDLVVDPFTGTGTVGVVCRAIGRRFIGTEVDPKLAQLARDRIAATRRDTSEGGFNAESTHRA